MRNLVVCCDGTWNTPDQKDRGRVVPSNVVKMARAVETDASTLIGRNRPEQKLYYHIGVGTKKGLDRFLGGGLGRGLSDNIKHAYSWLVRTFRDGDRIFLFGFSRGAYTARSLAGMISLCGLVTDEAQIEEADEVYRNAFDKKGLDAARAFREGKRTPRVRFIGVWDTVGALGIPARTRWAPLQKASRWLRHVTRRTKYAHGFHRVRLGRNVDYAFHALAIDEHRGPFAPSLWEKHERDGELPDDRVQQVWFAGAHTNIGGGYADPGLCDHAFMWMAKHAMRAGLWLDEMYLGMRIDPNAHGELRDSMTRAYQFLGPIIREVGGANALNERIHISAVRRHRNLTNTYHPDNAFHADDEDADGFFEPRLPIVNDGMDLIREARTNLGKGGWIKKVFDDEKAGAVDEGV